MSDDVRADARRLLHGITPGEWAWTKYDDQYEIWTQDETVEPGDVADNVQHLADAEFIAAAPALVDRLLTELDYAETLLEQQGVLGKRCRSLTAERDAALATLQQVREWAEQRRYDGPPTDDLATVLLDGAAHQLLRILDGGAR